MKLMLYGVMQNKRNKNKKKRSTNEKRRHSRQIYSSHRIDKIKILTPLVFTPKQQSKVKQNPKEKSQSNSNPQATPFTYIRNPLLL